MWPIIWLVCVLHVLHGASKYQMCTFCRCLNGPRTSIHTHGQHSTFYFKLVSHSPKWLRYKGDLFSFSCFVSNVQRQTHIIIQTVTVITILEKMSVSLSSRRAWQNQLAERKKREYWIQLKWQLLPWAHHSLGHYSPKLCVCAWKVGVSWVSGWVYLVYELISHHPAQGHQALLRVYTQTQLKV